MKLYFFTYAFPYGNTISWKTIELENFSPAFDRIEVIPFTYRDPVERNIQVPGNVSLHQPLIDPRNKKFILLRLARVISSKHRGKFFKEFWKNKAYRSFRSFSSWLIDSHHLLDLMKHPLIQQLGKEADENTLWYFFWGRHPALIIPFIKDNYKGKIACRFHGYDLYPEQSNGYIPYHEDILKNTDLFLPCSRHGYNFLSKQEGVAKEKIFVARLGCRSNGLATHHRTGTLKIVSCSDMVPVKRLDLLLEAMALLDIQVSWMHIGDGECMKSLKEKASKIQSPNINIQFTGYLRNSEVMNLLQTNNFDVFVNVSSSEGVPVTIMEAFSAGIPVIATNVGGTSELVDASNGFLINKNISPLELAGVLKMFYLLDDNSILMKRNAAVERFRILADADKNARLLLQQFTQLLSFTKEV